MKRTKRFVSLTLVLVLIAALALLAGCNKNEGDASPSPDGVSPDVVSPSPDGGTTPDGTTPDDGTTPNTPPPATAQIPVKKDTGTETREGTLVSNEQGFSVYVFTDLFNVENTAEGLVITGKDQDALGGEFKLSMKIVSKDDPEPEAGVNDETGMVQLYNRSLYDGVLVQSVTIFPLAAAGVNQVYLNAMSESVHIP